MAKGNFSQQKGEGNGRRLRRLWQGKNTQQVKTSVKYNRLYFSRVSSIIPDEVKPSDEVPKVQKRLRRQVSYKREGRGT